MHLNGRSVAMRNLEVFEEIVRIKKLNLETLSKVVILKIGSSLENEADHETLHEIVLTLNAVNKKLNKVVS